MTEPEELEEEDDPPVSEELCDAKMSALEWKLRFLMVTTTLGLIALAVQLVRGFH